MKRIYAALLWKDVKYYIRVPDVDGCITSGNTIEEAVENSKDALAACICVLEDENAKVPEPTDPILVRDSNATTVLIDVDTIRYREETETRAVRKNVSMPFWLARMAELKGINCSQVLQDALKHELDLV